MESINKCKLLEYPPNTIQAVRKIHGLDKPGVMGECIEILEEWIKKQDHFLKKNMDKKLLEWIILSCKGSVERAKSRLDKFCTMKTMIPKFSEKYDARNDLQDMVPTNLVVMPKFLDDFYRVAVFKSYKLQPGRMSLLNYFRYTLILTEYIRQHDYVNGFVAVVDYTDADVIEYVKLMNIVEMRQAAALLLDSYSLRIKEIHLVSPSSALGLVVSLFKQVLSPKLSERIIMHKTIDTVYNYVPRDMLPSDLGGKQKSTIELQEEWLDVLSSKEHVQYMKDMEEYRVDESRRHQNGYVHEYSGIAGTFRNLEVD